MTVQYSEVQYREQYCTLHCSAEDSAERQYSTVSDDNAEEVQYSGVQYRVWYSTVQCSTEDSTVQFSTVQRTVHRAVHYSTVQYR